MIHSLFIPSTVTFALTVPPIPISICPASATLRMHELSLFAVSFIVLGRIERGPCVQAAASLLF